MKKFVIKKPNPTNSKIWEWKTHMPFENSPFVDLVKYDTQAEAEAAATEWDPASQVVEIEVPDN
jgi:hypothetical protein